MAVTAEQLAATAIWVDTFADTAQDIKEALATVLDAIWGGFDGWYRDDLIDELSAQTVDLLRASIADLHGLADQYAATTLDTLLDEPTSITTTTLPEPRNGVDLVGVYRRPAEMYRRRVATGMDEDEALAKAFRRRDNMAETDLLIAQRDAQVLQFDRKLVTGYRRIVRPELSESGSCGLCIVASDRIYRTDELMPIHARCKCVTMPVMGEEDPGDSLNGRDLEDFYREAGSTAAADLKKTRYQVHTHGEYGPVLTRAGEHFKGPADVKPLDEDPVKARRMLDSAVPVLESLQQRRSAGHEIQDQLDYQLELVDRLTRIAA